MEFTSGLRAKQVDGYVQNLPTFLTLDKVWKQVLGNSVLMLTSLTPTNVWKQVLGNTVLMTKCGNGCQGLCAYADFPDTEQSEELGVRLPFTNADFPDPEQSEELGVRRLCTNAAYSDTEADLQLVTINCHKRHISII